MVPSLITSIDFFVGNPTDSLERGIQEIHTFFDVVLTVHRRYYVEIKCQLDATDEFFIADLTACSTCFGHLYAHHQEL
jgi:hypothetical protein